MNGSEEAKLLESIRSDQPGAFESFVSLFEDRLFRFGMRMCGEREDARDVLQDTLFQAFKSIKTLKHPEALKSWLYRVAANACLMKRRRGKFEPEKELSLEELGPSDPGAPAAEIPDPAALPDQALLRTELGERVRRAVAEVPPHYRIVLVMRDMERLSTSEVAEALGVPETTVKMRLHRARLMVRRSLEAALATGSGGGA
jgi:RNA polymerase sigma-70 factor (ECF subfamily)